MIYFVIASQKMTQKILRCDIVKIVATLTLSSFWRMINTRTQLILYLIFSTHYKVMMIALSTFLLFHLQWSISYFKPTLQW